MQCILLKLANFSPTLPSFSPKLPLMLIYKRKKNGGGDLPKTAKLYTSTACDACEILNFWEGVLENAETF